MDPATIGLIAAGIKAAIEAYNRLEEASKGLTEEQRDTRRRLRKDLVALAHELAKDGDDPA